MILSEVSLYDGKIVNFDISKNLIYKKTLGAGGTGDTHLFYDDVADKYFAIKKYVPKPGNDVDDCYKRFIDEIKILMDVSHKNIVRIYNYYLYPTLKAGFIQMEYIEGKCISEFVPSEDKKWEDIFIEAIDAFTYLEKREILHRDIRISNFMINVDNELKIIDFGFGKKYDSTNDENSIFLNWPVTEKPEELVIDKKYDTRTEIYYLGNLFKNLLQNIKDFSYSDIIAKMCSINTSSRYQSFKEIKESMNNSFFANISFNENEKTVYKSFSNQLSDSLVRFNGIRVFKTVISEIMRSLESVISSNSLEDYVQGNDKVLGCFIESNYTYKKMNNILQSNLVIHLLTFFDLIYYMK